MNGSQGGFWERCTPVHVVCVGNELAKDDGVGIRVGRVLRALGLPEQVSVHFYQELGLDLVELLASGAEVIVIDAIARGEAPGRCHVLDADELARGAPGAMTCHSFGVAEMLAIARHLSGTGRMAWVRLVGVEVEDVTGFGTKLTPSVARALPDLVDQVLAMMGAPPGLIRQGRALANLTPAELPIVELHAG